MSTPRNLTRQRLVQAALDLFAQQGIADTPTKQIAELAEVNEVTLFRNFGNKQGLLLAVMEESDIFDRLAAALGQDIDQASSPAEAIAQYANSYLRLCEAVPETLRSIIGEAGKYPIENREALGRGIHRTHQSLLQRLDRFGLGGSDRVVSLIHVTLLGYAMLEVTTEFHRLWPTRETFIEDLVYLVLGTPIATSTPIIDLPTTLVQTLFQRAQKQGARELALVYLLFGAGVSPTEIVRLERGHHLSDRNGQLLQITQGDRRQVPVNQWIMGKRYGSSQKNPLTQYLKSRKDSHSALLLGVNDEPLSLATIEAIWQELTIDLKTLEGKPPTIDQAQQTWRVEMLRRGISLADMQGLTGASIEQLRPYGKRAQECAVLEQSLSLDKSR